MTKRTWILAAVAVVLAGLVYWFEYGPGTRLEVRTERRERVGAEGYEVTVPRGYGVLTDPMPPFVGAVVLVKETSAIVTRGHSSTIVIRRVPQEMGGVFDPQNGLFCEAMGRMVAASRRVTFGHAGIIDAPFGRTCEILMNDGGDVQIRVVVAYKDTRQWMITCRLETGDDVAERGCQHVIDHIAMK